MVAPRRNSKLKHLNIHLDESRDRYACDIRVSRRDRPYVRKVQYFETLSGAVGWRDEIRGKLGLPPAEDVA